MPQLKNRKETYTLGAIISYIYTQIPGARPRLPALLLH
jgi:hypothetical protein